jgi:hypothetical protein
MRTFGKLTLVAALTLVLLVPSGGSHARTRHCVAPEIPDCCKRVMCIGDSARSSCVSRCVWNITAGYCWSSPKYSPLWARSE